MNKNKTITTAVLLAAGMGSRLRPMTNNMPKCLTKVNGSSILGHLIESLHVHGFKRLIVVVGEFESQIRDYLDQIAGNLKIEYVVSSKYKTTNNIYSLWLTRNKIQEPFLLLESDLIFSPTLLEGMLVPDRIAVSQILPWMKGTTITTNGCFPNKVTAFQIGPYFQSIENLFKTVNIYSFSMPSWERVSKRLDCFISRGSVNDYYESVFEEMIADGSLHFQCVFFGKDRWYEIDTPHDLIECERMVRGMEVGLL